MHYPSALPWIILILGAINVVFLGGKRRAFGVFVAQLDTSFNHTVSLAELNWIGDSYAALGYLLATPCSWLLLRLHRPFRLFQLLGALLVLISCITSAFVPSPHWLFLTHTAIHGLGSAFVVSSVGLIVNEYFKGGPHEILARTLVSGGSVASILFVEIYALMIACMGWRVALMALGGIYFIVLALPVIVFRKNPDVADYSSEGGRCAGAISRRHVPLCIMWFLDRILLSIATYGLLLNLTDYVRQHTNSLVESAHLTTAFAGGEAITYVIGAFLTGLTKRWLDGKLRFLLLVTSILMAGALTAWHFFKTSSAAAFPLAFLSGFGMGPSITFLFPAGVEVTDLPGHIAYPLSLAGMGTGMMLSPLFSALLAERFHFHFFFLILAGVTWLKVINLIVAILFHKRVAVPNEYEPIEGQNV